MSLSVRARLVFARYGLYIAVSFLLVSAVALGAAWSVWASPGTEVITEEVDVEEFVVDSHTEAIVTGDNITLYEPGERLVDMPVYFYGETPVLTVVVNTSVPSGASVAVDQVLLLEVEASRGGVSFFEEVRVVEATSDRTRSGQVVMQSTIDMVEVERMVREVRVGMRGVGSLETRVVLRVSYESARYADEMTMSSEVVVGERAYWLVDDLAGNARHSQLRSEEVVLAPDWGLVGLYGGLGVVLLLIGVGIGWRSLQGFDVEGLETTLARSEFGEWISSGEIPTRADKEYVSVVSLEDLVDIGIDSNKRVIYDGSIDAYAVVDADIVYYYTSEGEDIKEWLDV